MAWRSSRALRAEFPWLKSPLPTLWTNSYFVSTVRGAPLAVIKQYIEERLKADAPRQGTASSWSSRSRPRRPRRRSSPPGCGLRGTFTTRCSVKPCAFSTSCGSRRSGRPPGRSAKTQKGERRTAFKAVRARFRLQVVDDGPPRHPVQERVLDRRPLGCGRDPEGRAASLPGRRAVRPERAWASALPAHHRVRLHRGEEEQCRRFKAGALEWFGLRLPIFSIRSTARRGKRKR